MKINLSVGIWHNTQSTFPRNFRHSLFSEFDHLTWFGIVKFPSHVLCPFKGLLADGTESGKTSVVRTYLAENVCSLKRQWFFYLLQGVTARSLEGQFIYLCLFAPCHSYTLSTTYVVGHSN